MSNIQDDSEDTQKEPTAESVAAESGEEGSSENQSVLIPVETGEDGAYVILVHGIADSEWNSQERWKQWQQWMATIGFDDEYKIWRYQYDLSDDEAQVLSRDGIESEALRLLECLKSCREGETDETRGKKHFAFVMLDIGGIIVKKALSIASHDPAKYGSLDSLTSVLIFVNTPHRAIRLGDIEDHVGELLSLNPSYPYRAIEKIQNVSRSIQNVNDAFIESKFLNRALVCSIASDSLRDSESAEAEGEESSDAENNDDDDDDDDDDVDAGVGDDGANDTNDEGVNGDEDDKEDKEDKEDTTDDGGEDDGDEGGDDDGDDDGGDDDEDSDSTAREDAVVDENKDDAENPSESAEESPDQPAESDDSPANLKIYQPSCYYGTPGEMTYKSSSSHYKLLREANGLTEDMVNELKKAAVNHLKSTIDTKYLQLVQSQAPPVFPPDLARSERLPTSWADSILESTPYKEWSKQNGMAILHLHGTSNVSDKSQALIERLNQAPYRDSETVSDDTIYFEFNRQDPRFNNVHSMLAFFHNTITNQRLHADLAWEPNELERLYHYRGWSLEDLLDALAIRTWNSDNLTPLMIGRLDECDRESRSWFLEKLAQLRVSDHSRSCWIISSQNDDDLNPGIAQWTKIDLDDFKGGVSSNVINSALAQNTSLQLSPPASEPLLEQALYCVQYAYRPMSVDELVTMVSLQDQAEWTDDKDQELRRTISDGSNSVLYVQNNEVYSHHAPLSTDSKETQKAHADLAKRCLQYLRKSEVLEEMNDFCECYESLTELPIALRRHNLITYAVKHWAWHYLLAEDCRPFQDAIDFFSVECNKSAFGNTFYTLGNPLIRIQKDYKSPLPLVAMLGLEDLVREFLRLENDSTTFNTDVGFSLKEAARNGHTSIACLLMDTLLEDGRKEYRSVISDAIGEAASFGAGGSLYHLVKYASTIVGFEWPPNLMVRVSLLGLHEITKILLTSGLNPNPPDVLQGRSPLHLASLNGHLETVRVLVDGKAVLQCLAQYGRPPLHAAVSSGNPDIIRCLVEAGANPDTPDDDDLSPLQFAMTWGRTEAMRELLKLGASPDHGREGEDDPAWQEKPLLYCARFQYMQGMQLLLEHGADLGCKSGKLSPLYLAVTKGNIEIARMLLEKGLDPNENPEGYDFLLLVAQDLSTNAVEMLGLLLDHGARIEEEDVSTEYRRTVLARAAGNSNIEVLKFLLGRGADVNHCGKNSTPPIYTASWSSLYDHVRLLVDAGADINVLVEFNKWRPVIGAYDNPKILKYLLDKGADMNVVSDDGTCLHVAIMYGMTDSVKVLLKYKSKLDLEVIYPLTREPSADDGYTALSLACDKGNARVVRLLLEAGANRHHRSRLGSRPIDICVYFGHQDAASVLLEYRDPLDEADEHGNTVLHFISDDTPRSLVRLLVNGGADLHASNKYGVTPLERAVDSPNTAVAKYLISKKADATQCSETRHSLAHISCAKNDLATLRVLVEKGRLDLKVADSAKGAPSIVMLLVQVWREPDMELLRYLVEVGKVDYQRRSGYLEYPLIATTAYRHIPQTRYLLEQGANPDIEASDGRRPLHLASVHKITDLIDCLLEFKVQTLVDGVPPRDKMLRSPVHFAAVSGNWDVFQKITGLYDDSELNKPDGAGWTPLFWALLNPSVEVEVIQNLIDHGADLWARVKSRKTDWSPLKLARYIGVSDDVRELLTPKPPTRVAGPNGKEEQWEEEFHLTKKAAKSNNRICDSCRVSIRGITYACRVCDGYDLCFRCYMSRDVFHRSHLDRDDWDERGPEYEEEDADSGDEAPKGGDSSGLDDLASHTEADSLADSDHDGDEAEKAVDELEDLSSDSDSVQDVESEADVSDNNDD